ncbi:peptide synthetase, partial [Coniochaeta sp. PMI_546]
MLGILKAGGAFIPIDPSHPENRRRTLVREIRAGLILASSEHLVTCKGLTDVVVEVSAASLALLSQPTETNTKTSVETTTKNIAYAIFTSGSTGTPKTVLVEHAAFCTSLIAQGKAFSMSPSSRLVQFSNYVFDVALGDIFMTLAFGGTVCIPSDEDRIQNIATFMSRARVTIAQFTPSFLRTIDPDDVPTLDTVVIGGEPATQQILSTWCGRVQLINAYGPAETTICCSHHPYTSAEDSPTNIGHGLNASCWVVDPDDYNELAPIGCTGELLVQSPALARGYANDQHLTDRSFVENVRWMPNMHESRFYRTGDLVKYNFDGTMEYVGRKDTQAK